MTLYFSTVGANGVDKRLGEAWKTYLNDHSEDVYLGILEELVPYMFTPKDVQEEYKEPAMAYSYYITEREQIMGDSRWYPVKVDEMMGFNVPDGFVICDKIEGRTNQGGRNYYLVSDEINEKLQESGFSWWNEEGRTGIDIEFLELDPVIAALSGKRILECSIDDFMDLYQCEKKAEIDTAYGKVGIYYEPDKYETIEHAIVDIGTGWCDIQYVIKPTTTWDYDQVIYNIPEYSGIMETIIVQMLGK